MRARRPIISVLAVCHRDLVAAKRWLKWASYLAQQPGGDVNKETLVVFCTHRVAAMGGLLQLSESILPSKRFFNVFYVVSPDENEVGYPMSANHIFLRSLEHCKANWPTLAPLFIEPDCVPTAPDWFHAIQKEYDSHDKDFMGGLTEGGHPHMTGNAVHPPHWEVSAPSIKTVLERQSSGGMFPDHRGFPFDLWIANDVLKSFHRATTIFQVWAPGHWNNGNIGRIQSGAKLVHQDKIGTLILTIARNNWPDFVEHLPLPNSFFMLQNPTGTIDIDGRVFEFKKCARTPDGAWWSVMRPDTYEDEMFLSSVAGRLGIESISEEDYKNLILQSKRNT